MPTPAGTVERTFAALADPTRRGILERIGREDASISDLADRCEMTLTGVRKHVRVLEDAGLVSTRKHHAQAWARADGDGGPAPLGRRRALDR